MRELHWHPNGSEWQYYLEDEGRMTVFGSEGKALTFDHRAGDVGYVPFAMGHYIENTGPSTMRFLEMFRSNQFASLSLNQWMKLTPSELVQSHLNIAQGVLDGLNLEELPLVGFSMGGGEVARYMGRHGGARVAKAVLVSAVTPYLVQGPDNPDGMPRATFDAMIEGL